ncbi:MAG: TonB family protein [Terracidiphilus sp.]|jgi:periplasmic protein TonB
MFEDATFETMGTIHTRSRNWMIATFGLNASILAALIAIPLFYPSALPQMVSAILMEAPAPVEETRPVVRQEHMPTMQTEMPEGVLQAPSRIPRDPYIPNTPEPRMTGDVMSLGGPVTGTGSADNPFSGHHVQPVVQQVVKPRQISSGVMEGMLINKVLPVYPAPARAMHIAGRVELQATISRDGTIDHLRVVDGPMLLQAAALEAVRQWRYRPYLLNGEPVEVETTINVDFKLD